MDLTCRVDTTNLMRANTILMRHSNRSPARCLNSTAYHVIKDVADGFPVVAQGTIDSDMNVTTSPAVLNSGRLSKDKTRQHELIAFGNRTPDDEDVSAQNTAERIVLARMHPGSKYSIETGNRWGIAPPDFGRGRSMSRRFGGSATDSTALFWAWVKEVAERMIRARHSSTGFLKKSWIDLKVSLLPFAMGSNNPFGGSGMITNYSDISPAKEGSNAVICRVSNTLGVGYGTTKELSEKYNQANHEIAEPRIRDAINREFKKKLDLADKQEWAKDEPELRALGLLVNP